MTWPPLVVVTDRRLAAAAGHDLVKVVAAAVDAGARSVLLREKDLAPFERLSLAGQMVDCLDPVGGQLLVAADGPVDEPLLSLAAGVHLSGNAPKLRQLSGLLPDNCRNFGRSCHSVGDLAAARAEGAGYVTLSPVWETASKPGYGPALGVEGLAAAVAAVPGLPVYALGGIGPGRVAACVEAGAVGVAVMGAVMGAVDPGAVVRQILVEAGETDP